MKREYLDFINDIKNNIEQIELFVEDMNFGQFKKDTKTNYAVIHCLEIMGEAAKHIPNEVRDKYPNVPWRKIAGLRDKITHFYWGIDLGTVWKVVKDNLPDVKKYIEEVK